MRPLLAIFMLRLQWLMPLPLAHGLGKCLGWAMLAAPSKMRRYARANIRLCFPDADATEHKRLLRRSYEELGKSIMEAGICWLSSPRRITRLVREIEGAELVEEIQRTRAGRGVIVAAPHLGSWELMGPYWARRYPLHLFYRKARHADMEALITRIRERIGAKAHLATAGGVRDVRKAMRDGEVVSIFPDQEPSGRAVFVPFFGRPCLTMTLIPKLARHSNAIIVHCYTERLSWGRGYRIHFRMAEAEANSDDLETAVAAISRGIEQMVRECPEQYQWVYPRFKAQPEGWGNPYKGQPK